VPDETPSYEPMLAAFHRAFAVELRAMLDTLPVTRGHKVLDMACGDGVYSRWLADRVGADGQVVAVDLMPAYLDIARETGGGSSVISFAAAAIEALPFADDTFDLCWCAQSLYSLADPTDALRQLRRIAKPGGVVAVLEEDTLHTVILPWPPELELAVRVAELQALAETADKPRRFYVGRSLGRVFREAGLERGSTRTFATDRVQPLGEDERVFFTEYLRRLAERVDAYLDRRFRPRFEQLVDPRSEGFLLDDPDLTTTSISYVVWGRKPSL
jgi:ubiquinone/menaquinone biosynthesis C-methylase UbiE